MSDDQVFEEEDDPCLICMDELDAGAMTKLGCAHRFHTEVRYFNDIVVKLAFLSLVLQCFGYCFGFSASALGSMSRARVPPVARTRCFQTNIRRCRNL